MSVSGFLTFSVFLGLFLPSLLIHFSQVVQQQKAECSQKLEGLSMWLAGAASLLASQKAGAESDDVNVLQEKQNKLKVWNFKSQGQHPETLQLVFCPCLCRWIHCDTVMFTSLTISNLFSLALQEVEKDLKTKQEGIAEAIRSVEELLSERGESLSPEERKKLQEALATMKEQYSALTDSVNTSLTEVNSAINTTVQQNTQRVRGWRWL